MAKRIASCACGALSASVETEPVKISLCHCEACKKRTGSAFGVAVFFGRDDAKTSGPSHVFTRRGESGKHVTFHFCPDCGSTVFWYPEFRPDRIAIALGAFGDDPGLMPEQAVHGERKAPWVTIDLP